MKRKPGNIIRFSFSENNFCLGLLKPEFLCTNGCYLALAPKSYIMTQYDANGDVVTKKGAKGDFN